MIFNISNIEDLDSCDFFYHGDTLAGLFFDRTKKTLRLTISKWHTEKSTEIRFQDVIGFRISTCGFWREDEHIFALRYIEPDNERILPDLLKRKEKYPVYPLKEKEAYFETALKFVSGDELVVACKQVALERYQY